MPKLHMPESENMQSILMITFLFATLIGVSVLTTDPVLQKFLAMGFYFGFIGFVVLRGKIVELDANRHHNLEEQIYRMGQKVPFKLETFIRKRLILGIYTSHQPGARDWYAYEDEIEATENSSLKEYGKIQSIIRLMPEREDKFQNFEPRKQAARWKGEGPFDHGGSDFCVSLLCPLPYKERGYDIPVVFTVFGSRLAEKLMQGWDSELKEISDFDAGSVIAAMDGNKPLVVYDAQQPVIQK